MFKREYWVAIVKDFFKPLWHLISTIRRACQNLVVFNWNFLLHTKGLVLKNIQIWMDYLVDW